MILLLIHTDFVLELETRIVGRIHFALGLEMWIVDCSYCASVVLETLRVAHNHYDLAELEMVLDYCTHCASVELEKQLDDCIHHEHLSPEKVRETNSHCMRPVLESYMYDPAVTALEVCEHYVLWEREQESLRLKDYPFCVVLPA